MKNTPPIAIILNGPPGSGKDEGAKTIIAHDPIHAKHLEFKTQLFEHTIDLFEIDADLFYSLYNDRRTKEEPSIHLTLDGVELFSPREALIHTSENVYKPRYGKDYFGECAARSIATGCINVFSDGGFREELNPVIRMVDGRVALIHLHREGCDFSKDSRDYVLVDNTLTFNITNYGNESYYTEIINIYNYVKSYFWGSKI